ncbi:hypothetical protein BDV39DRAFT_36553 [Aspergillus sergii]|uniref:Uncharacterized protein n=1 Tax=Aspergillus sergii TaxID=1034303 RepID=A0A5N6XF10_9EURO|nr:hypothetical protein BDV39DRAFT_36553 [Aspergillus sergii]
MLVWLRGVQQYVERSQACKPIDMNTEKKSTVLRLIFIEITFLLGEQVKEGTMWLRGVKGAVLITERPIHRTETGVFQSIDIILERLVCLVDISKLRHEEHCQLPARLTIDRIMSLPLCHRGSCKYDICSVPIPSTLS